jgi:hypothetical protein
MEKQTVVHSTSVVERVGIFTSILCLVHCLGPALLAPLFPLLGWFSHSHFLEVVMWAISVFLLMPGMLRARWAGKVLRVVVAVMGTLAIVLHVDSLLHAAFMIVAAIQAVSIWGRWRNH